MQDINSVIFEENDLMPENDPVQKEMRIEYNSLFLFSSAEDNIKIEKISSFIHPNKIKDNT